MVHALCIYVWSATNFFFSSSFSEIRYFCNAGFFCNASENMNKNVDEERLEFYPITGLYFT